MFCQGNTRMVNAVKDQHPDKFDVSLRPRDDHQDELKTHGIASHGIVCLDPQGETLWIKADHEVSQEEFDAGVTTVLEKLAN